MKCMPLAASIVAIALAGCGSQAPSSTTSPHTTGPATPSTTTATSSGPSRALSPPTTTSSPAAPQNPSHGGHPHAPRPYSGRLRWHAAALASTRAFVRWFDRWLAGESSARRAPDVTPAYAATLRASANNVPPAARGHVAAVLYLIPVAMPPGAAHPHEVSVYTVTRSQGTVIRFTIRERL